MRALHMSTIAMLPQRVCHFSHCYSPTSSTNASFPHHATRHNLYFAISTFVATAVVAIATTTLPPVAVGHNSYEHATSCYFRYTDVDLSLSWGCSLCVASTATLLHRLCQQYFASLTLTQCHDLRLPILQLIFVRAHFFLFQLVSFYCYFHHFVPFPLRIPAACVCVLLI